VTLARVAAPLLGVLVLLTAPAAYPAGFTLEQILSSPFASDIVAAPAGRAAAWVSDARGKRNLWLATTRSGDGRFESSPLTHYSADDGLEIADLAFVPHHGELLVEQSHHLRGRSGIRTRSRLCTIP
jgi:hypothetical protein